MMRAAIAALLALTQAGLVLAQAPAGRRNFVACPVVRDTKTAPCWLAEYKGEVYFLGVQSGVAGDFYPPQLSHQALVEGTVAEGPRVCGGIPLRPVKVSVLEEIATACNTMLPAEDGIEAPAVPRSPGIGKAPSWVKTEGTDRTTLYFDFDQDFLSVHSLTALTNLASAAKQGKSARVEVTGYRGATLLSSGDTMREKADMGEVRARKVAAILVGLGLPEASVAVVAPGENAKPDGVNDPWSRRVVIVVKP